MNKLFAFTMISLSLSASSSALAAERTVTLGIARGLPAWVESGAVVLACGVTYRRLGVEHDRTHRWGQSWRAWQ